jgi:hypothetical protein
VLGPARFGSLRDTSLVDPPPVCPRERLPAPVSSLRRAQGNGWSLPHPASRAGNRTADVHMLSSPHGVWHRSRFGGHAIHKKEKFGSCEITPEVSCRCGRDGLAGHTRGRRTGVLAIASRLAVLSRQGRAIRARCELAASNKNNRGYGEVGRAWWRAPSLTLGEREPVRAGLLPQGSLRRESELRRSWGPTFLCRFGIKLGRRGPRPVGRDPRASPSCPALPPSSCSSAAFAVSDSARSCHEGEHHCDELHYRSSELDPDSVHDALLPAPSLRGKPHPAVCGWAVRPEEWRDARGEIAKRLPGAHGAAQRRRAAAPGTWLDRSGPPRRYDSVPYTKKTIQPPQRLREALPRSGPLAASGLIRLSIWISQAPLILLGERISQ